MKINELFFTPYQRIFGKVGMFCVISMQIIQLAVSDQTSSYTKIYTSTYDIHYN